MQLNRLIADAKAHAGGENCASGHQWESNGGRACPKDLPANCSQAVYECVTCGAVDYGEAGGPGATDCQSCQFRWMAED